MYKKRNEIQNEELLARSTKPAHAFLNACRPVQKDAVWLSATGEFPRTNRTLTVTHLNMRRRSRRTSPEPEVRPGEGPHERVLPKPRDVEKERDHRTGEGPQERRGTSWEGPHERDLRRGEGLQERDPRRGTSWDLTSVWCFGPINMKLFDKETFNVKRLQLYIIRSDYHNHNHLERRY